MKIVLACPSCSWPGRTEVLNEGVDWQCRHCDHRLRFEPAGSAVTTCPVCGNNEIYKKKDFPHWLGLSLLAAACIGFMVFQGLYQPTIAWSILIGLAVIDAALYLWVGDVLVCYRCQTHVRGVATLPEHHPYDLGIAERYRQERLRKQA
ncbi:MAG: hypothetical protein AB7K24_02615 [Gemmataceae bacterium]